MTVGCLVRYTSGREMMSVHVQHWLPQGCRVKTVFTHFEGDLHMQTPTQLPTSNKFFVPIVLLIIDGLFNPLSFFFPLISLGTGSFITGMSSPIPVIVIALILSVVSLMAAWGLGIIDIPLNLILLVFLFRPTLKRALA